MFELSVPDLYTEKVFHGKRQLFQFKTNETETEFFPHSDSFGLDYRLDKVNSKCWPFCLNTRYRFTTLQIFGQTLKCNVIWTRVIRNAGHFASIKRVIDLQHCKVLAKL